MDKKDFQSLARNALFLFKKRGVYYSKRRIYNHPRKMGGNSMRGKLYVVWYRIDTGWKVTGAMRYDEALFVQKNNESAGYECKLLPRHQVTELDIVEG